MATTPTTVRVDESQLERFKEIQASFTSGAEFSSWILNMYKLHESTKTTDLFSRDIQSIESMFGAIIGTLTGVVSRAEGAILAKDESIAGELRERDQIVEDLKNEMEILRQELRAKDEEIGNRDQSIKEVQKALQENQAALEKVQKDFSITSKLNDMLEKEKAQYQAIAEANKALVQEVAELKEKLSASEKEANASTHRADELQHRLALNEEKYVNEIQALKDAHKQDLERAEALKEVAVSKATLAAKEAAQTKIEARMEKENELRDKIDNMQETINTYSVTDAAKDKEIERLNKAVAELKDKMPAVSKKGKGSKPRINTSNSTAEETKTEE